MTVKSLQYIAAAMLHMDRQLNCFLTPIDHGDVIKTVRYGRLQVFVINPD